MVAPAPAKKKEVVKKDIARKEAARKDTVRNEAHRKESPRKEAPRKERCARCGVTIAGKLTPCVWREHIVCEHCHSRLRAYEPAMAICPGAKPVLRYARGAEDARPHPGVGGWMSSMGRKLVSIF